MESNAIKSNTSKTSASKNSDTNNLKLSVYGGAGIGLLFGVIMGTSVTPTVSIMFGTLTTLLAAILGLDDKYFSNTKAVRIGSFGFACVFGAYLGLFVRSHDLLSPSLMSLKEEYLALGFSEEQALNFISQKAFGLLIQTKTTNEPSASEDPSQANSPVTTQLVMANTPVSQQHSSVLFSAPIELSGCDELEYTDNSLPLDEVLNNFELTDGVWEELASAVTTEIAPYKQKAILLTVKEAVCKIDEVKEESCDALTPEIVKNNYQTVLTTMTNYNENWQTVASAIDLSSLPEEDKLHSLRLANKTLCGF